VSLKVCCFVGWKNVSLIKTALPRCIDMKMRCQRWRFSGGGSPDAVAERMLRGGWCRYSQIPTAEKCAWLEGQRIWRFLPPPRRLCIRRILCVSVCVFVCMYAKYLKKIWTDFEEILWRGRAWPRKESVRFWWRSRFFRWSWIIFNYSLPIALKHTD